MKKYNLISLEEAEKLTLKDNTRYFADYINPGLAKFIHILGLDKVNIEYAEGMYIYTECGRKVLDFSGGMGVLNLGHNHPRILRARKKFNEEKRMDISKVFISRYQAALAKNLAEIFPGDLTYSFFCNSGAEANEGALKIALMFQGPGKDKIVHSDVGYHGKTFGAMSVSGSGVFKELFKTIPGTLSVPYGDIDATKELFEERSVMGKCDIAAMIIEGVHTGTTVIVPPEGYLKELSLLCNKYGVILIVDEVFTGFGRTGKMFSFEHEGIVPDIVTFSKSFGGGKASIAGYIVTPKIFHKTYATTKGCSIHNTTFGGMGEECATAIEALNVFNDENIPVNAKKMGVYLLSRMTGLKEKYPNYIKEVKGIGCLAVFELFNSTKVIGSSFMNLVPNVSIVNEMLTGLVPALIISELFKSHDIMIYLGNRSDLILVNPALIVKEEEIDCFMNSLDKVLSKGMVKLGAGLAGNLV